MTRARMGLVTAIALGTLLLAPTLYAHERPDAGNDGNDETAGPVPDDGG